jgi:hypothetical protein
LTEGQFSFYELKKGSPMKNVCSIILVLFISTFLSFTSFALQKPGAHFWGDADGSGAIDGTDLTEMKNALKGSGYDFSNVIPPSGFTQDFDGNNNWPQGTDLTDMKLYLSEPAPMTEKAGHPVTIVLNTPTFTVIAGGSAEISAYVVDSATDSDGKQDTRAGWGVVFRLNPASDCLTVELQGRDVLPQLGDTNSDTRWFPHITYGATAEAFEYTLDDVPDSGLATVKVRPGPACLNGDSILIDVFIPSDAQAHVSQTRNQNPILAASSIVGIAGGSGPCTVTSVLVSPDTGTEDTVGNAYTLIATCAEGGTEDVTATSTASGNCTGSGGLLDFPNTCGDDDPPNCDICDPGSGLCDTIDVQEDGDFIVGVTCTGFPVTEGTDSPLGCNYSWSDGVSCNDLDDDADLNAIIMDPNCYKNGTNAGCDEVNCDTTDWICNVDFGAVSGTFDCLDDGDTVVSLDLQPDNPDMDWSDTLFFVGKIYWNEGLCTTPICNTGTTWNQSVGCGLFVGNCLYVSQPFDCIEDITAQRGSATDTETVNIFDCQITGCDAYEMNFGDTISDSYMSLPWGIDTLDNCSTYVEYLQDDNDVYYVVEKGGTYTAWIDEWLHYLLPPRAIVTGAKLLVQYFTGNKFDGINGIEYSYDGISFNPSGIVPINTTSEVGDSISLPLDPDRTTFEARYQNDSTGNSDRAVYFDYWQTKVFYHCCPK